MMKSTPKLERANASAADVDHAPVSEQVMQDRARESMERLLSSAMSLLVSEGYAEFNLKKLSTQSGVSIGSLYHRFKNKKELVREVQHRVYAEILDDHMAIIERLSASRQRLKPLVRVLVCDFAEHIRRAAPPIRVFMQIAAFDEDIGRVGSELFQRVRGDYTALLISRVGEIKHADPEHAARACFEMIYSCLSRRLGLLAPASPLGEADWAVFMDDISDMAVLFLTARR